MNFITKNTLAIQKEVAQYPNASLVAVVKNRKQEEIEYVLEAKPSIIAFSRVQEALEKLPQLHFSGAVHMIGRLQKNKVKKAVETFDMIESVDSLDLAQKIDKEAQKRKKRMPILLQVNISKDPHKAGFSEKEISNAILEIKKYKNIQICGLMTTLLRNATEKETRNFFVSLRYLSQKLQKQNILPEYAKELSMGMSNDYHIALEEGATLVRVGTKLFLKEEKR